MAQPCVLFRAWLCFIISGLPCTPQAAVAHGAGEATAAEAACRRALAARTAAAGSTASLPVASAHCLLAQVLLDLGRCEACLEGCEKGGVCSAHM